MPIRLEIATVILAAQITGDAGKLTQFNIRNSLDAANLLVDMHASDERKRWEGNPPPPPPAPGKKSH